MRGGSPDHIGGSPVRIMSPALCLSARLKAPFQGDGGLLLSNVLGRIERVGLGIELVFGD